MPHKLAPTRSPWPIAFASFCLGACASAAISTQAQSPSAPATVDAQAPAPVVKAAHRGQVLALADAPAQRAGNNKATIQHLARGTQAYVGRLELEAGAGVPLHRDESEEIIFVLEGSGEVSIDGVSSAVERGSTIYMPANAEVSFQNGAAKMVGLQVFAGPQSAEKYDAWPIVPHA